MILLIEDDNETDYQWVKHHGKFQAFTLKSTGILNMLVTDTLIMSDVRNTAKAYTPRMWSGLWDTGASRSSITRRIVDELGLIPIGSTSINTANGAVTANTYFVNFGLPNGVTVRHVLVSCAELGDDIDVLTGMDIMKHGGFFITNVNNKTTFSFRTPSMREIDFVKESRNVK